MYKHTLHSIHSQVNNKKQSDESTDSVAYSFFELY